MVQKYEKRLKDGKYFNQFGIISREIGCLGTKPVDATKIMKL